MLRRCPPAAALSFVGPALAVKAYLDKIGDIIYGQRLGLECLDRRGSP